MEITERRVRLTSVSLEDRLIEIIQSEQQREKRLKKRIISASVTFGTIPKGLTFLSAESLKEREKGKCVHKRNI